MGEIHEDIDMTQGREKLGCGWWFLIIIMPLLALIIGLILSTMSDERQRRIGSIVAKRSLILFIAYSILLLLFVSLFSIGIRELAKTIPKSPSLPFPEEKVEVVIEKYEFSGPYETSYRETRSPDTGAKFFWIYAKVKNTGKRAVYEPMWVEFRITYAGQEIHPEGQGGDRKDYPSFPSPKVDKLYPGVAVEGWVYWEVPQAASAEDLEVTYQGRKLTLPR